MSSFDPGYLSVLGFVALLWLAIFCILVRRYVKQMPDAPDEDAADDERIASVRAALEPETNRVRAGDVQWSERK
jgi:hypothetical protein